MKFKFFNSSSGLDSTYRKFLLEINFKYQEMFMRKPIAIKPEKNKKNNPTFSSISSEKQFKCRNIKKNIEIKIGIASAIAAWPS